MSDVVHLFRLTLSVVRVEDGRSKETSVAVGRIVDFYGGGQVVHVIELALSLLFVVSHNVQIHHKWGLEVKGVSSVKINMA